MYASFGARWRARGDHSTLTTPWQPLRSFLYSRARRTSSSIWLSLLVFSLSLCVSVSRRFSSLPALTSRLCWRSALTALVSVGALPRVCLCSALASAVDSAPVSALLPSHLASATPLARRVALYTYIPIWTRTYKVFIL